MKNVSWPKPGYASITSSTISNIPYDLIFATKFNDSSILITIISCDYLNLPKFSPGGLANQINIQIKLNYIRNVFFISI
jgi:hypothetical protein